MAPENETEPDPGVPTGRRKARRVHWALAAVIAVAAFALGAAASTGVTTGVMDGRVTMLKKQLAAAGPVNPHAQIQVRTGNAGWARIAHYDGLEQGNEVKVSLYPETAPNGPDRQDATEPGVQGAYTTLIVRPSPQTRLCAVGSITVGSETITLGDPICT